LHLARVQNALVASGSPAGTLQENLDEIDAVSQHIVTRVNGRAPYFAMLREWVRKTKQAGEFDDLLAFGIDPEVLI
jgi:hypothetical protein